MMILGIEAAAKVAGAAVCRNGVILAEEFTDGALTHSETLMPMIDRVMSRAGVGISDIDLLTLTVGPGSFTGLRIGAATAKGLALGRACVGEDGRMAGGIPILPLGTLESLCFGGAIGAAPAPEKDWLLVGTMDARRSQVYAAVYDTDLRPVMAPEAMPPADLAAFLKEKARPCLFMGDAADLYEAFFADQLGGLYHKAPEDIRSLRAGTSCRLAERKLEEAARNGVKAPVVPGWELRIEYLRKPQAEREREERLKKQKQAERK